MKRRPEVGDRGEMHFVVATEHTIDFCDDRMPAVLSTPSLIWNLEYAAVNALAPMLESHERCVGSQVDIQHLAPTGFVNAYLLTGNDRYLEPWRRKVAKINAQGKEIDGRM
ncbi:MAG TPA: hypothetical protein QF564_15410 [Pirellulaceae bacterium]|jgi:hypothetical protein|nr:hypothetical protein [Pirellulaceae bacterium]